MKWTMHELAKSFRSAADRFLAPDNLLHIFGQIMLIILVLLIIRLVLALSHIFVEKLFHPQVTGQTLYIEERRAKTLKTLTQSVINYVIYFIGGVMILQLLGINTTSLLTAAGIGGLAVGFGAQNLVRDVITGFFILFEDQFGVGDYISAGGVSGVVEEMGIRVTKIRDFGGQLHIVPNGEMKQVTNYMGKSMRVMFDVRVAYSADVDRAIGILEELFAKEARKNPSIVEGPQVLGVQELGERGVNLRVLARTAAMEQWDVERELKKQIIKRFTEAGIEIQNPLRFLLVQEPKGGGGQGAGVGQGEV
ncbi:MAG: mechanosensitive ion channel family protein [Syntrophothermus sp.]